MELREILESEQAGIAILQRVVKLHASHAPTLVLCTEAMAEATGRMIKLNNLYHYRDPADAGGNGNGKEQANAVGADGAGTAE